MTPLHISILIGHLSEEVQDCPTPTHKQYEQDLFESGLIKMPVGITDLGMAHLSQICALPLPRRGFIGFDGNEIKP